VAVIAVTASPTASSDTALQRDHHNMGLPMGTIPWVRPVIVVFTLPAGSCGRSLQSSMSAVV
jgi:hypothetical protein